VAIKYTGRTATCSATAARSSCTFGNEGIQSSHLLWRLRNGGTPQRQPPVQILHIGAADLDTAYSSRGSAGAASAAPAIVSRYVPTDRKGGLAQSFGCGCGLCSSGYAALNKSPRISCITTFSSRSLKSMSVRPMTA
jgi:hypothetical protein